MRLTAHSWQRLVWSLLLALLSGGVLTLAVLMVTVQGVAEIPALLEEYTRAAMWSVIYLALLTWITGLVMRRLSRGFLLTAVVVMSLTIANHFKEVITSTPLELYELLQVFQLGPIVALNAKSLSVTPATAGGVILALAWFALLRWPLRRVTELNWRWSLPAAGGGLAAFLAVFVVWADPLVYIPLDIPLTTSVSQAYVYQQSFVPLGLWRSVLFQDVSVTDYSQTKVEGTIKSRIESVIADVEDTSTDVQPNIILILSESFFDVTTLDGVEFETDPLAEFHALQQESVSGKFYTRSLGYGTCNIELEVLTGINSRLLSQNDNPLYWEPEMLASFPTVPGLLQDAGYYTAFLHLYNDSIYNRRELFSCLGFDDMYFSEDLAEIDPIARRAADYWGYLDRKISGAYYGDAYMTELLIDLYEREKDDGPVFLYAASMENHTPYNADKYDHYDYPFTADLSEEATDVLNAYVQGAAQSSKALGELIDYFSQVEEPTIVIFYGDHRPGLGLEEEGSVYTELGMLEGAVTGAPVDTLRELYSTEYLIWANDPSLLSDPVGYGTDTSSNYLGLELLQAAGIELPRYWKLVDRMHQESLVYNWSFFVSADGTASRAMPGRADSAPFDLMTYALYDAEQEQYITDWLGETG